MSSVNQRKGKSAPGGFWLNKHWRVCGTSSQWHAAIDFYGEEGWLNIEGADRPKFIAEIDYEGEIQLDNENIKEILQVSPESLLAPARR